MNRHLSRTIAMQSVYEWDFREGLSLSVSARLGSTESRQAEAGQDSTTQDASAAPKTDNVNPDEITERNIAAYQEDTDAEFVRSIVNGVIEHCDEIDNLITKFAPEWPIDQIALIDKTILRVAVFELLYREDVPPKVIINEAVELGKTFGSESTSRFVNGVLGTIYRQSARYNPADDLPKDSDNKDKTVRGETSHIIEKTKQEKDKTHEPKN